jgi:ubiquinone biosynthesis protein UbiJ
VSEQHSETAEAPQVAAALVDTRREEFLGRVVKLREEVDHLNQRLDRLEK